jgi:hypothetical protein
MLRVRRHLLERSGLYVPVAAIWLCPDRRFEKQFVEKASSLRIRW